MAVIAAAKEISADAVEEAVITLIEQQKMALQAFLSGQHGSISKKFILHQ